MTEMSQCRQVEFMQALDNRFSDLSFASSYALNLVSQLAMYQKSAIYTDFSQMASVFKNSAYSSNQKAQLIGQYFFDFLAKSIAYASPDRTASATTY